jgi:hypothetical protein
MNFIGGRALASSKPGRAGKGLASAVTPNTKSIAASEDQAKSSVGVDATLLPGF